MITSEDKMALIVSKKDGSIRYVFDLDYTSLTGAEQDLLEEIAREKGLKISLQEMKGKSYFKSIVDTLEKL